MVSIVLSMSWVRALLSKPVQQGGPCLDGLRRLRRRFDLRSIHELTAAMLRTALKEGGGKWENVGVSWTHYVWFLEQALGDGPEAQTAVSAVRAGPVGEEWDTLCTHCTVEVVEDESPEAEDACPL